MIGVGACGLELLAFPSVTPLIGPDERAQVNTDEPRLNGEIHVKALNHAVKRFGFGATEVKARRGRGAR